MRKLLVIFLCAIGISVYAAEYASSMPPSTMMQSVNNAGYMTTGSTYTSTVYEIGSSTPTTSLPGRTICKGLPGKDDGTYDPNNPQFAPIGDVVLPLLLMALIYALMAFRIKSIKQ